MALGAGDGYPHRPGISVSEKGDHPATRSTIFLQHPCSVLKGYDVMAWLGWELYFLFGTVEYPFVSMATCTVDRVWYYWRLGVWLLGPWDGGMAQGTSNPQ